MSAPPPRDQLAEVSVAHVNSKLNRQDTLVETENVKPPGAYLGNKMLDSYVNGVLCRRIETTDGRVKKTSTTS